MLFLIGAAFGLRRGRGPAGARALTCALAANAIAGIALPAVCYSAYPAWMWGYLVDPTRVPVWVVVAIFALYWVPFAVGYATRSWRALAGGLVAQLALIALTWPRYSTVTTMEGFAAGVQIPPGSLPLIAWGGPAALAVVVALLIAAGRPRDRHRASNRLPSNRLP